MSFLKKIASPFYDFGEGQEPGQEQSQSAPATPESPATPAPRVLKPTTVRPQIDEDTKQQILADIEKATPAALNDFYSLVQSMADLPMDDQTRFKSAFIAFQKQTKSGVDALLDGIRKRFGALDVTVSEFETELKSAQKEIEAKRKQAAQTQTKMEELSQQIVDLKSQQSQLLMQASQEEQELSTQQMVFMATVDSVRAELSEQESQINAYLAPSLQSSTPRIRKRS